MKIDLSCPLHVYIFIRDKGRCVYCGDYGFVADHVFPRCHGGKSIRENMVFACVPCNSRKGGRLDVWFITVAFKHLLDVGESLAWVDEYLINTSLTLEEALEDAAQIKLCAGCGDAIPQHRRKLSNYCSPLCRSVHLHKLRRKFPKNLYQDAPGRVQKIF